MTDEESVELAEKFLLPVPQAYRHFNLSAFCVMDELFEVLASMRGGGPQLDELPPDEQEAVLNAASELLALGRAQAAGELTRLGRAQSWTQADYDMAAEGEWQHALNREGREPLIADAIARRDLEPHQSKEKAVRRKAIRKRRGKRLDRIREYLPSVREK